MKKTWEPVPFSCVKVDGGFWEERIRLIREATAPECLVRCTDGPRGANFRRAAGREEGPFQGIYFDDSDVYKVLEGVAYVLQGGAAPELEARADALIDDIAAAQRPDGYLDTYFILGHMDQAWTDCNLHEAYCIGHMIEAGIAYAQATGKKRLLETAIRAVGQMMTVFGPGKRTWITGHEEIELALVRLYRYTGEKKYLDFSMWLVEQRGHAPLESKAEWAKNAGYCQADVPARKLTKVTGHAVRAMYYYTALTDLAGLTQDEELHAALHRLWNNVVPANLYVTGGIGQQSDNEGFTRDWHLPNLTAYCETCAAIGMALWNDRMNRMEGDSKFADLVETELYNGALAGLSLDGKAFFYDNPLASVGKYRRSAWFNCSCCPTNLCRFIPSVPGYAYAKDGGTLIVNQYIQGELKAPVGGSETCLRVETNYPWSGEIRMTLLKKGGADRILVRIPGWCEKWSLSVPCGGPADGYVCFSLKEGETAALSLEMPVRILTQDARIRETRGRAAVARGPVVYCAEEIDNPGIPTEYFHAEIGLPDGEADVRYAPDLLGGVCTVAKGGLMLVPYYAWCNRGRGGMAVWLKK